MAQRVMDAEELDTNAAEWCDRRQGSIAHIKGGKTDREYFVARAFMDSAGILSCASGTTPADAIETCDRTIKDAAEFYLVEFRRRFALGTPRAELETLAAMVGVELWPEA